MKKMLFFAAVMAAAVVACNKPSNDNPMLENEQMELALTNVMTKGYVETAEFIDSPYDKLHGQTPDGKSERALMLSSYLTPQSGAPANYFVGEAFSKNANGESDNLWHHNPKVYWPMGGQLAFLAYSVNIPFKGTAINWDEANAASKLVLDVSEEYLQDDILYSSVAAETIPAAGSGEGATPKGCVAMLFKHAQAWIQFQIKVGEASMNSIVKLKDITIQDLYTRGELTIVGGADATSSWNFRKETAVDKAMDDTYNVTAAANYISDAVQYMDMLVPAQKQTKFLMHYTLEGQDTVLEYEYDLATADWQAGKKYIYEITFNPYEITVKPTVTAFDVVNPGATGFPSTLE